MTQNSATPGPWKFGHVGTSAFWVGPDYDQKFVASIPWDIEDARDEARANARLIAAAPDLLMAIRRVREDAYLNPSAAAQVDAAIQKATGK